MTAISWSRRLAGPALERLRSDGREVAWMPDWMRLGNVLYQWLWAYQGQAEGLDRRVLVNEDTARWVDVFPVARARLLVDRADVRFLDRRSRPWEHEVRHDRPFDPPLLEEFIAEMLLPGSRFVPGPPDRLVVNVRRGDYYTVAAHRADFGMDVEGFLGRALSQVVADGEPVVDIHVVSDDPAWCAEHLTVLEEVAPTRFASSSDGPRVNLAELAGASRVILTNSTFSYWGGYLGDVLVPGRRVWAPRMFQRQSLGGRSHLLRPHWTVVE